VMSHDILAMLDYNGILDRMMAKHSSCRSYSDSGTIETSHKEPPCPIKFSTLSVSPNKIRCEWIAREDHFQSGPIVAAPTYRCYFSDKRAEPVERIIDELG
jgi:hypothetical protein